MRKIDDSGKNSCSVSFRLGAEARSRPNGFSTMTRAPVAQRRLAEPLDDRREHARRDREVVERPLGAAERLRAAGRTWPGRCSRRRRSAAAAPASANAASSSAAVLVPGCRGPAARNCVSVQPARATPMTGTSSLPRPDHRLERREDLLVGQIAGGAEERPARRTCGACHGAVSGLASRRARRTGSASRTGACRRSRPRRAKRSGSNSAALSTGAGTASSMAASSVQRPSPESETRPANFGEIAGFRAAPPPSDRAATRRSRCRAARARRRRRRSKSY